ncbi:hypothetical protein BCV70DRAFT_200941 [Testicularia cyperi]|uniref:Proteasome assembly chaperone 2 n=1 Tax=Testicularia cyperi TaxID=1882483 RepID=A0A317XM25_9BASI|nr:hypothetical protein BCV70DRAFT_200941 [Testicularia cyperi]
MTTTETTPFYIPVAKPGASSSSANTLFQGATLLIPAVSIGSVPQLTVDLLLQSDDLALKKVGRLDPSFCVPFVGAQEPSPAHHGSTGLCTALEVFANDQGLVVIQQRSPVLKSLESEYIAALTTWIGSVGIDQVLWVTSLDAGARIDSELHTPVLSLLPNTTSAAPPTSSSSSSTSKSAPIVDRVRTAFPTFSPPSHDHEYARGAAATDNSSSYATDVPYIPGSLVTRKLLRHLNASSANTPLKFQFAAILYFSAEGDTRPDAHLLASLITRDILSLPLHTIADNNNSNDADADADGQLVWKEPPSWNSLFGPPPSSDLYG